MSDAFNQALSFALRWEGDYSNHPNDKGGETNFGITHAVYRAYRVSRSLSPQSVRLISSTEVRDIYYKRYWLASHASLLRPDLAMCHFDWAVNAGVGRAVMTLQQVVGVEADGIVGSMTRAAVASHQAAHSDKWLCDRYNEIRAFCYRRWGVGSQAVFLQGWMNRLNALRREVN
jgi:lysozyme family protein